MKLSVRGVEYFIEGQFTGNDLPVMILLHGFGGSTGCFSHIADMFSERLNVFSVDLLGHGESDSPGDPGRYVVDEQVEDLKFITTRLGKPFILLGYSMGGRLALQYACRYPEDLICLILESTGAGLTDEQQRLERIKLDRRRAEHLMRDLPEFFAQWNRMSIFQNEIPPAPDLAVQIGEIQVSQNPQGLSNSLLGFGTGRMPPLHEQLKDLETPSLILAGINDEKFVKYGQELNRLIPGSRFSVIPKAAHRIHLDNPNAFAGEISLYLESAGIIKNKDI